MILATNGKKYGELDVSVSDSFMNQKLAAMARRIYDSFCRMKEVAYLEMRETWERAGGKPLFELSLVGTGSCDFDEYKSVTVSDSVRGQLFETTCYQDSSVLKHMSIGQEALVVRLKINVIMYGEFKQAEEWSDKSWQPSPLAEDAVALVLYHYRRFFSECHPYPTWKITMTGNPQIATTAISKIE